MALGDNRETLLDLKLDYKGYDVYFLQVLTHTHETIDSHQSFVDAALLCPNFQMQEHQNDQSVPDSPTVSPSAGSEDLLSAPALKPFKSVDLFTPTPPNTRLQRGIALGAEGRRLRTTGRSVDPRKGLYLNQVHTTIPSTR